MKVSEIIANVAPQPLSKARNLAWVGWWSGYLVANFRGRPAMYIFGPAIPESEFQKIIKNPFPDRLFTTNIKNKYQCHKVAA
jgi:hypothetical protein